MATRGPQVVLEGYARSVARGGGGKTMRANIAAMDQLVSSGLVADGNAVDGSSRTGAQPYDGVVAQFPHEPLSGYEVPTPLLNLNLAGAIVGGDFGVNGDLTVTGELAGPVTATGTMMPRMLADRFADVVNVKDCGAVFDGNSHPLSNYYPTLAAAQGVYPHAVALTDEMDGIAIQAAINLCASRMSNYSYGGEVRLPVGIGLINQPLVINASTISLRAPSSGFMMRANYGPLLPSSVTRLLWTGAARTPGQGQINMLTVAATVAASRMVTGSNVSGILFDCNFVAGCAGPVFLSVREATIDCATREPNGIAYAGAALTAGSTSVVLSTTVGVRVGESIVSASLPEGSYVQAIVDGTHINTSAQATATSTETVTIGGEGIRFDVVGGLPDSNDTQLCYVKFHGIALNGAANATAPLVFLGGSGTGSGPGLTHFGNTSVMTFEFLGLVRNNGAGVVCNNTDHNYFNLINTQLVGAGTASLLVCNGSLDPANGGARFHKFGHILGAGAIQFIGTDTGGFTGATVGCVIDFLDRQNSAAYPTVGAGASVRLGADNYTPGLAFLSNNSSFGTYAITAHIPDSTALGGNARGNYTVDLQASRTAATQVATGLQSTIGGGVNNTATGAQSIVAGGSTNTASGTASSVLGGQGNAASGVYSMGVGNGSAADLYGLLALSAGVIASGRRAQYNVQILRALSAANTTPVRLTADLLAASAINCCNLTYSDQANALRVQLIALDAGGGLNFYAWTQPLGLLRRLGVAGTAVYVPGTPVILTNGTTAGIVITEAADTVNAGYSLTFTPPTGNSVIWRVVATVEWTRCDGA